MLPEKIMTSLYEIGAIQFGEFLLKSGQTSPIYMNLRKIISYPDLLRTIATAMWEKVADYPFDLVCGVPYTALPIATCLSLDHHIPMVMRRKEKKEYGTKQTIEGVFQPGQSCLIIEDVVTSGMSIIETADELEKAGLQIQHLVALIDRQQGGRATLEQKYQLHTILTMKQILHFLREATFVKPNEKQIVETLLATGS